MASSTTSAEPLNGSGTTGADNPSTRQAVWVNVTSKDCPSSSPFLQMVSEDATLSAIALDPEIDTKNSKESSLAAALGMPTVRVLALSHPPLPSDADTSTHTFGTVYQKGRACHLSLLEGITTENVLLYRSDNVDLQLEHVQVLIEYDRRYLSLIETDPFSGPMVKLLGFTRSPQGLSKFFEHYKEEQLKEGKEQWKDVVCMIELPKAYREDVCGGCGAEEGKEGAPLMHCGKCREQRYCSRECQKGDWKRHKGVCGILR